jgi:hypothetical protein
MSIRRIALDTLAASPVLWLAAPAAPRLFPGRLLHQAALWAVWEGAFAEAERLFEAAARCYQADINVVPLARLRAHQAMARARASARDGLDVADCLDVERRLARLDRIEAPWPPFPLVDARSLLASWNDHEAVAADPAAGDPPATLDAAA